jgi:predicted polyphosphate/ATP-dependent NAD kinase
VIRAASVAAGTGGGTPAIPRVGLIVNPIAGMGGAVGLKGTDGRTVVRRARQLGAAPHAASRAAAALEELARAKLELTLLTCAGAMGEDAATASGLRPTVVYRPAKRDTSGEDTRRAAQALVGSGVDVIAFAGGDGTARDVFAAVGDAVPVIGIPAGVKIHSAVFAVNPRAAGDLMVTVVRGRSTGTREAEVMDVDESAYRRGRLSTRLFGYLRVPDDARLVQAGKVRSRSEDAAADELARAVVDTMEADTMYIVCPGTTTRRISRLLGLESTLLGVDVIRDGRVLALDVGERDLLALIEGHPRARIIVTPIGGQGYLFGRGNQQISARVVRGVGIENVVVIATPAKLAALGGRPLLVDIDDEDVNQAFAGFVPVMTGRDQRAIYAVEFPRAA